MDYATIHDRLMFHKYDRDRLLRNYDTLVRDLATAEHEADVADESRRLIQEAAMRTLSNLSVRIGNIVSTAITEVLGDSYTFKLDFKVAYGKIATEMYLEKDGKQYDLRKDTGDGVVDIVSLALRVAVLCIDRRKLRRILILDEPCGAISVEYQQTLGRMLKHLADKLNLQIIMVAAHGSVMQIPDAKVFNSNEFTEGAIL